MGETAEKNPEIYTAIAGVMRDISAVGKDKVFKSNQGSYKFRGIDDVMNALHPAMVKNKIFVVPVILEQARDTKTTRNGALMSVSICKIRYDFYAIDGSCVSAIVIGEGMDTGDKATNKAMSIAFKYACFQVFCIPTDEMIDPDGERPEFEKEDEVKKSVHKSQKQKEQKDSVKTETAESKDEQVDSLITTAMLNTIKAEQKRTGVTDAQIFGRKAVAANSFEEMKTSEFKHIMEIFKKTPDLNGGQQDE